MLMHCLLETPDAEQALVLGHRAADRRMMDHHDPEQALLASFIKHSGQPPALGFTKIAGRHEGRGRARGCHTDQRDCAAHLEIGECLAIPWRISSVACHPGAPGAAHFVERAGNVGVVIAGHDRDIISAAEQFQPLPGHVDLYVEGEIDQVARDGDVVWRGRLHVCNDRVYDIVVQKLPPVAVPVYVACDPLGDQIAIGYIGKRAKMDVGDMREPEHATTSRT